MRADNKTKSEIVREMLDDLLGIYPTDKIYKAIRGSLVDQRLGYCIKRGLLEERDGKYFITEKGKAVLDEALKLMEALVREKRLVEY